MAQRAVSEISEHVRQALKNVKATNHYSLTAINDAKKVIESIPAEQLSAVLQESIGKSMELWRAAAYVLASCAQTDAIDQWIIEGLTHKDSERYEYMLQVVGHQHLTRFAEVVNQLIESRAESLFWAIDAAGYLCTESNRAALIRYSKSLGNQLCGMVLLQALVKFRSENARSMFRDAFYLGNVDDYRIYAAWGLGQLGDARALGFLRDWLDDKIEDGTCPSYEAMRAAQALSAIFDWSLEWGADDIPRAKDLATANEDLAGIDCVPFRQLGFILFDDPKFNMEHAEAALRQSTCAVRHDKDALVVSYEDGPSLYVRFEQGDWVRQQSIIIRGMAQTGDSEIVRLLDRVPKCDRRFEITFANLNDVLMETNTLIDVQARLQDLTNGVIYNCWNEGIS